MAKQKTRAELEREILERDVKIAALDTEAKRYEERDLNRRRTIVKILSKFTSVAQPPSGDFYPRSFGMDRSNHNTAEPEVLSWLEICAEIGKLLSQRHQVILQDEVNALSTDVGMLLEDKRNRDNDRRPGY